MAVCPHSSVHAQAPAANSYSTTAFRWLVYAMFAALIATLVLGLVLAFRTMKMKWIVWLMLVLGLAIPALCLWLGQRR